MNYYDEFGLRQDASAQQIRQAYRNLARLLHPDLQADPKLKSLADCQMKRLAEVFDVLNNSGKRRLYDESLTSLTAPDGSVFRSVSDDRVAGHSWYAHFSRTELLRTHWYWVLLATAALGLAIAQRGSFEGSTVAPISMRAPEPIPSAAFAAQADRAAAKRNAAKAGSAALATSVRTRVSVPMLQARTAHPAASSLATTARPSEALVSGSSAPSPNVASEDAAAPATQAASRPAEVSFGGTWLYAPEVAEPLEPGQYRAVYVEFTIAEAGQRLVGDYRARFKVPDLAVSSEVVFQARGPAAEGTAMLDWRSSGGAKGKAELKLRTQNVMHVSWWTTEFGKEPTLGSGTAVLIRQLGH